MLNAYPVQPDQELLIEPLRIRAPRRVRYTRWVRITRIVLLNGWIAGVLLAQWLVGPAQRNDLLIIALLSAVIFLALEGYYRSRYHLLSKGEATVGVILSRKIIEEKNSNKYQIHSYQIHYCYWDRQGQVHDVRISVSRQVYNGCPDGAPITILYDPRYGTASLPLILLREAELV